jgi:hypothetical protein
MHEGLKKIMKKSKYRTGEQLFRKISEHRTPNIEVLITSL